MIKFSKIRNGLLSAALLITTAINAPALANSSPTLPELSPRQIAGDVRIITHPQSGQQDYILPSFDPFEDDPTLAGTAQLRTANNTVTIDGHNIRGGAVLDLIFYYNTNSADPYENRGYGDAVFLSGDYADVTLRDSRILECSEDIQDVVYYHEDYYAPSFHSSLYRPYRHYSGFNGFGSLAYGGFNSFGVIGGSLLGRSFIGNRGFSTRANTLRRNINRNRRADERLRDTRRRELEERLSDTNERRRDARERVRDNRNDSRPRRRNNDRIRNNDRREDRRPRRRLTEEQRAAVISRNSDSTVASNNNTTNRRRNIRPNRGSQGVVSGRNSLRSDRRSGREVRLTNASTTRTSPKPSSSKQVSQRKSSSKKTQNRSQNRPQNSSGKQSRTTRNSQSRNKSGSRNNSRNFRNRSNLRGARIMALGPMASLFGRSNIRKISTQCAREEILSLHIPQNRIDAARYDGLTVVVIDRTGHERPVYIPPNYIEGFRQASSQINRTQGYPAPIAPEPYQPNPNHEQAPCPVGTTPQSDGTCLSTPAYSGYPQ